MSSTRTSVFSKQSSVTTKSSHGSINTVEGKYSRLIDALALEVELNGTRKGATTDCRSSLRNTDSLSSKSNGTLNLTGNSQNTPDDLLQPNEASEELDTCRTAHSTASTSSSNPHLPPLHRVYADSGVGDENNTATAEFEVSQKSSRGNRWLGGLKRQAKKVPCKAREVVKSTKRFTRTLLGFVPTAMAARNPFEGL
jgi:hypothetical protein